MIWEEKSNELHITESGKSLKFGSKLAGVFGAIGLFVSLLCIYTFFSEPGNPLWYSIIGFFFSLVIFLIPISYKNLNLKSNVIINSGGQCVEYFAAERNKGIQFPFQNFKNIHIQKIYRNSGSSRAHVIYNVYLRFKDGAFFWLDNFSEISSVKESITKILQYIDLPVIDIDNIFPGKNIGADYGEFVQSNHVEKTKYVEIKSFGSGYEIKLLQPLDFVTYLSIFSIFMNFTLIPILILMNATEGDGFNPMIIFAVPFVLIFLGIVFVVFLMMSKNYKLYCTSMDLKVRMSFPFFLNKFLEREVNIPAEKIRYIRVNRLETGNVWLSIELEKDFSLQHLGLFYYLFNLTAMNVPSSENSSGNKNTLGLWNISFMNREGFSATYKDAIYIENFLQTQLNLREKEIDF